METSFDLTDITEVTLKMWMSQYVNQNILELFVSFFCHSGKVEKCT